MPNFINPTPFVKNYTLEGFLGQRWITGKDSWKQYMGRMIRKMLIAYSNEQREKSEPLKILKVVIDLETMDRQY